MNALTERRDALVARLDRGWEKIERAHAAGQDTTNLDDFWLGLLREYEQVCDALTRDLSPSPAPDSGVSVRAAHAAQAALFDAPARFETGGR